MEEEINTLHYYVMHVEARFEFLDLSAKYHQYFVERCGLTQYPPSKSQMRDFSLFFHKYHQYFGIYWFFCQLFGNFLVFSIHQRNQKALLLLVNTIKPKNELRSKGSN